MTFEDHLDHVVKRARSFYNANHPGHFLVNTIIPVDSPKIPPLFDFDLDHQLTVWLDHKLAAARSLWRAKRELDDDSIPAICPQFGIAEHSAWLGLEVQFQEDTCLPEPLLKSPDDLDRMTYTEQAKWFQYMKKGYEYLHTKKDGSFVLSNRGTMTPMDLANALRGDELFTDFILQPDFVHRLMKFLAKAIDWYYRHLCDWADEIDGGFVQYIGNGWMGPNFIGHLSNDVAMLCSTQIYEEFGFPYEIELTKKYNGSFYHVHNEKLHFVPKVAELSGLRLLEISNDPKTRLALDDVERIFSMSGIANLMLHGTSDQVRNHVDKLKTRNIFLQVSCEDRKDAEDIIALVRDRSRDLE